MCTSCTLEISGRNYVFLGFLGGRGWGLWLVFLDWFQQHGAGSQITVYIVFTDTGHLDQAHAYCAACVGVASNRAGLPGSGCCASRHAVSVSLCARRMRLQLQLELLVNSSSKDFALQISKTSSCCKQCILDQLNKPFRGCCSMQPQLLNSRSPPAEITPVILS